MNVSLARTTLVKEPDKYGEINEYTKNSGEAVGRLGTAIESIFVPNQEQAYA